mmetsp:Transcript_105084/g.181638  ORF Transcript_105084/g.181638 Transcript_105084/m.181638 type:complete len:86 (+) Transcript_105084:777-1034(+)
MTKEQEMTMASECVVQTQTEEANTTLPLQFYPSPMQRRGSGCFDNCSAGHQDSRWRQLSALFCLLRDSSQQKEIKPCDPFEKLRR